MFAAAGAIKPLVDLLDGNEGPEAQEEAAGAILALADHEGNRVAITESGGIGWLVMLLGSNNQKAREHAEGALVQLSFEAANRVLIIKKLVDMLQDVDTSSTGRAEGTRAGRRGARQPRERVGGQPQVDCRCRMASRRCSRCSTSTAHAQIHSVAAIIHLCRIEEQPDRYREGGRHPEDCRCGSTFSANTMKENALVQLVHARRVCGQGDGEWQQKNQDAITDAGAVGPLVAMLGSPAADMQAKAAGALANLAQNHHENQGAIARTGAVAPLCTLVREGSEETKDESAFAIWSLATDHGGNKDTIAKLGGIDPLLSLLVTGETKKSQALRAGALAALVSKHQDNRQVIAKRLVGLLGSVAVRTPDRAERVLNACSSFTSDSAANQVAIAKLGGIPPLIAWLQNSNVATQAHAAHAVLCLAMDNATTQVLIAKSDAIPPLINLVRKSSRGGSGAAARGLWHLASQDENRASLSARERSSH